MYLNFFGLREQPFGVTPDPRFLYLSAAHREAFSSLYYGIEASRGFLGLIAKPGMGKTTILFHLLEKFRTSARTAFLFQTQCNSREFMRYLLAELGYEGESQDFVRLHEEFNRRLLQEARAGNRLIVVIDEAQNLDASVLETVRLLSDFETPKAKLMHIILAGQPELADKLASPGLAQLRQRVSILHGLEPLPEWEIKSYIEHRMKVAGYEGEPVFTPEAYAAIADFSEGIPRNVNNFCFNALSLAYGLQQKVVDMDVVKEVISDLDISRLTTTKNKLRNVMPEPEPEPEPEPIAMHPVSGPAAMRRNQNAARSTVKRESEVAPRIVEEAAEEGAPVSAVAHAGEAVAVETRVSESVAAETKAEAESPRVAEKVNTPAPVGEKTPPVVATGAAPALTPVGDEAPAPAPAQVAAATLSSISAAAGAPKAAAKRQTDEILSPAEAAAYMQEVALKLKNWQRSLDQSLDALERAPRFQVDEEK